MKTIGVLGGLGPQATMDFVERIHRVAQELIPQNNNSGYPPMVVYYHRNPPILFGDNGKPVRPVQADPGLLEAAGELGRMADFLVIAANGPHTLQGEIEAAAGKEILSMIDVTLTEVERRSWANVGVLGLGKPVVYIEPLQQMGLAYQTIDPGLQRELDRAILDLMAGQAGKESTAVTRQAISELRAEVVDGVILGCTELPLLLKQHAAATDLLNPAHLLAEATIRYAIE